ncbi:MAG: Hsp70 family protein, partial [Micromonosporaceae bacterium]|nr:Hsp70 family protein [Micromonosporaceae bacterium]
MGRAHRLAIDLGTCHTVAVIRRDSSAPRALLFDGSPVLPSGVYASADGQIVVGRDAERMAQADPGRFEPFPKRRIDDTVILLGDTEVPVVDLFAALLGRVVLEARQAGVDPVEATVVTCPADWGPRRRAVLTAATAAAGLGQVELIDEPVAAASYCQGVAGQRLPLGGCLAVFDFGGGTLDITVIRNDPGGLRVLAVGGLDDLGGIDIDAALVGHLGQLVARDRPEAWRRLDAPSRAAEQRDRRVLWTEVRSAKEMLSRAASAPIHIPGLEEAVHLTREEVERLAKPLVDRAVDETRRVIDRVGLTGAGIQGASGRLGMPGGPGLPGGPGGQLAGIFLVGGASRMPLVASRLHARFGIAPTVPEQHELPVAFGALTAAHGPVVSPASGAAPVGTPPSGAAPVSPPAVPYPPPPFGPFGPFGPAGTGPVPGPGPVLGTGPNAAPVPVSKAGRRRRGQVRAVIAGAAAVAVIAACGFGGKSLISTVTDG